MAAPVPVRPTVSTVSAAAPLRSKRDSGCDDHAESVPPAHNMTLSDYEIVEKIKVTAKNALDETQRVPYDVFNTKLDVFNRQWKQPELLGGMWPIPKMVRAKGLGVPTSRAHLRTLKLDSFLTDCHSYLLTMSEALKIVTSGCIRSRDVNVKEIQRAMEVFKTLSSRLKAVLNEVNQALLEKSIPRHCPPTTVILPDDISCPQGLTLLKPRNIIVFRDFIILMEYINDVTVYFMENLSPTS